MKYFEFTFHTSPCTETVNDVLAAVLGEAGFESFVESEGGLTAYIQQALCDENTIKNAITEFPLPDTEITYTYVEAEDKDWNEEDEAHPVCSGLLYGAYVFGLAHTAYLDNHCCFILTFL